MLNGLLALNCEPDIVVMLAIDEHFKSVALAETFDQSLTVFEGAPGQVAGDAGIENAVAPIGDQIKPTARHLCIEEDVDGRDKPGHDQTQPQAFTAVPENA